MEASELQKLVEASRLTPEQAAKLAPLAPGTYCLHKSWGFGRVQALDLILARVVIDFQGRPGHSMELAYAADSLRLLPPEHILAQRARDPARLRALPPLELCRIVLNSHDGRATADEFQADLCGPVVPAAEWKTWWDNAKRAMKKDPHFGVPSKKNEPFVLRETPVAAHQELLQAFHEARGLREKLAAAESLLRRAEQIENVEQILPEIVAVLDEQIRRHQDFEPGLAIEAIWVRDELVRLHGLDHAAQIHQIHELLPKVHNLGEVLDSISTSKQKKLLPLIRQAYPDWRERLHALLQSASGKLLGEVVDFLLAEGQETELRQFLQRTVWNQSVSNELLAWIARQRNASRYQTVLADLIQPRLLAVMLDKLDRTAAEPGGRRKNDLRELLLADAELIPDLLQSATVEETRDLAKSILQSPAFDELDKRSLMSRVLKVCPAVQDLLASGQEGRAEPLIVSWESLQRRKAEYDELVHKKIPANIKDIAIARSYGDLRENFEFKAAKETQRVLARRKAEMEAELTRARGTDFSDARTDVVSIGTIVTVTDLDDQSSHTFTILGAWDGDPDRGIISYQTPLAQALIGRKPGEEAVFQMAGQSKRYRVEKIEKYKIA